jgi:hypothetical protein
MEKSCWHQQHGHITGDYEDLRAKETLQGHYRDTTGTLQRYYRDTTGTLQRYYRDTTETLQGHYRDTTGILQGQYRYRMKELNRGLPSSLDTQLYMCPGPSSPASQCVENRGQGTHTGHVMTEWIRGLTGPYRGV